MDFTIPMQLPPLRRAGLYPLLAYLLLAATTQVPRAQSSLCPRILDAGNTIGPIAYPTNHAQAQTFTPTLGGPVCEILHGVEAFGITTYDLYVVNAPGAGTPPPTNYTSNFLFRALNQSSFNTAGGGGINGKVTVTGLTVTAGVRYALVIVPTGLMAWRGHFGNPYTRGEAWFGMGGGVGGWTTSMVSDHTFRVLGPNVIPNNDLCANCQPIGLGTVTGSTVGATTDGSSTCLGDNDVWYCFTARCSGLVTVTTCGSAFDTVLSVHTGCPGTAGNQVACNNNCSGTPCPPPASCLAFNAVCGATYRIRVAGFLGAVGTFSLTLSQPAATPPPNDPIAGATTIGNVTNLPFSTCGATTDGPADCPITNDIWYRYTPTCQGTVTIDLCGSGFDTYLAVYSGPVGSLTLVACNDDNGPSCGGLSSSLRFANVACGSYYIRVGGWHGDYGCGDLTISCSNTVLNDDCRNAIRIGPGITYGTTIGATRSPLGTFFKEPCGGSVATADVWYSYRPPCNGQLVLETCPPPCIGAYYDSVVSVYQSCAPAVQLACNDDANCNTSYPYSSRVSVSVAGSIDYRIRVSGYRGRTGNFALRLTFTPASAPANDNICGASSVGCGSTRFTTCNATTSPQAAPGCTFTNDVWFRFTAPNCGGTVTVRTCNSALADTVLAVYSGTCASPVFVACNDNAANGTPCPGTWSYVTFTATASTTYWLRVGSPNGTTGNGIISITCPPPTSPRCPPVTPATPFQFATFNIAGLASNTPWAFRLMIPCCFDICVPNVPGVATTSDQNLDEEALAQAFVNAINSACSSPALFAEFHPHQAGFQEEYGLFTISAMDCGTGSPLQLWVGPAGANCNNLCLVTPGGLPTVGSCSFNPDIEQVDLPTTDCNNNGVPDYLDILRRTSPDLDRNNVPDECDARAARVASFGVSCPASSVGLDLKGTLPVLGENETFTVDGGTPNALAFLFMAPRAPVPFPLFANCLVYIDVTQLLTSFPLPPLDATGHSEVTFPLPANPALQGLDVAVQTLVSDAASPIGFALSNAVQLVLGF